MERIADDLAGDDPIHTWFEEFLADLAVYLGRQNDFTTFLRGREPLD